VERVYPELPPAGEPPIVAPGPIVAGRDLATADIIRQLFEADTALATTARNVQVAVDNGQVVMRGTVASDHDRQELQSRLATVPGVSRVDNRVEVNLR
jgi:osmotically-inducible protein OsmY